MATEAATPQYCYRWPRPAVTVDICVFTLQENVLKLLLIQRKNDPFQGCWALPGGFVDENEDLIDSAARELREETSVDGLPLVQFGAFGAPGRDPRGHTVSVGYMSVLPSEAHSTVLAGDDAGDARFFPVTALPSLAFDHAEILRCAWQCLRFESSASAATSEQDCTDLVDKCTDTVLGTLRVSSAELSNVAIGFEEETST